MQELKSEIKAIYSNNEQVLNAIEDEYSQYTSKEAERIYAPALLEEKLAEKKNKIDNTISENANKIDEAFNKALTKLEPNTEIINSLEYQAKLSNTLKLLELNKDMQDVSLLDFIVEANDATTMELIHRGYKENSYINIYMENHNIDNVKASWKQIAEGAKQALTPSKDPVNESYMSRLVRWKIENEY